MQLNSVNLSSTSRHSDSAQCLLTTKMKNIQNMLMVIAEKNINWAKINNFHGKNPEESPSVTLAHRFLVLETVKIHLIARDLSTADWALTQERKCIT